MPRNSTVSRCEMNKLHTRSIHLAASSSSSNATFTASSIGIFKVPAFELCVITCRIPGLNSIITNISTTYACVCLYVSINEQKACTRIFWKTEPPGQFSRDHRQVLLRNSWDHLAQEVLISTPRRFGKTISVSMFAAAMVFAAPRVELSIYSTCKRISQKLLRNVQKFFNEMVEHNMGAYNFKVIRQNMEEIVLQGPDGVNDVRIVNRSTPPWSRSASSRTWRTR